MPETNVFNGRIRLKSDVEANWNEHPIVPLSGEIIIYNIDQTHSYPRVKIGDGVSLVTNLPFINDVYTYNRREDFPNTGIIGKLYVALNTNALYVCTSSNTYTQLCKYKQTKTEVSQISLWLRGKMPDFQCESGKLTITSGILPTLSYSPVSVVYNIAQEVPTE